LTYFSLVADYAGVILIWPPPNTIIIKRIHVSKIQRLLVCKLLPAILFSILSRPHLHAFHHHNNSLLSPTAVLQVVFKDPTTNYLADMTPRLLRVSCITYECRLTPDISQCTTSVTDFPVAFSVVYVLAFNIVVISILQFHQASAPHLCHGLCTHMAHPKMCSLLCIAATARDLHQSAPHISMMSVLRRLAAVDFTKPKLSGTLPFCMQVFQRRPEVGGPLTSEFMPRVVFEVEDTRIVVWLGNSLLKLPPGEKYVVT